LRQDPELNLARSLTFRILKDPSRLSQGMIRIETRVVCTCIEISAMRYTIQKFIAIEYLKDVWFCEEIKCL
jgi:hypothetical protein